MIMYIYIYDGYDGAPRLCSLLEHFKQYQILNKKKKEKKRKEKNESEWSFPRRLHTTPIVNEYFSKLFARCQYALLYYNK